MLVFTEKDPAKEKNPKIPAMFSKLGSALIVTVDPEGDIIGCTVAHSAHEKSGFSTLGQLKMSDFNVPFTREFEPGKRVVGDELKVELQIEAKPQS